MNEKKYLLMMPEFMGYNDAIFQELKKRGECKFVNNEKNFCIRNNIKTLYIRARRHFSRSQDLINKYSYRLLSECIDDGNDNEIKEEYNYIICVNGHRYPDPFYKRIKENNPDAKFVLYLWDDVNNLISIEHKKYFDKIYSYNLDDCKKYSFSYVPMFVRSQYCGHIMKKYDVSLICTLHASRLEFIKNFYKKYLGTYKMFIYLYNPLNYEVPDYIKPFVYDKPIEYQKYINILQSSKSTLDLPNLRQTGPTTRFFDCLLTDTKVITTNNNIYNYPVYSDNILVIDRYDPIIDTDFIRSEYKTINYKPLDVKDWVDELLIGLTQ